MPSGVIAICGGGLIGASLGLALQSAGRPVRIFDRDPAVRELLAANTDPNPPEVTATWPEAARDVAVVVAAVPPVAIPQVLREAVTVAHPQALLTDVAGVKSSIVEAVERSLRDVDGAVERYVPGHPMAGSERSGPKAADGMLFSGSTWVLTPTSSTADAALAGITDLVRSLGARLLVLSPEQHDTIVGLVSHLPQLVASVLADVAAEAIGAERDAVMAVAGPGFRDSTRIAASDPELWLDIIDGNRQAVLRALESFDARLALVHAAVRERDEGVLAEVLRRAGEARRRLVPKGLEVATVDLSVPLNDRPGEIARITAALGSSGINIEDLAMRHATQGHRGSLLLRIQAASSDRARDALKTAGIRGVVVVGTQGSDEMAEEG